MQCYHQFVRLYAYNFVVVKNDLCVEQKWIFLVIAVSILLVVILNYYVINIALFGGRTNIAYIALAITILNTRWPDFSKVSVPKY